MKRISSLAFIMATIAMVIGCVAILVLYSTAYEVKRQDLIQMAQSQARLIEAVARFDRKFSASDLPGGATAATIFQVKDAMSVYKGFGETGEFVLGRKKVDQIDFLLPHRHHPLDSQGRSANETPNPIPFLSRLAEPMRRALSGKSGTVVGLDYRGEKVLAAHEPVVGLDLGIVAKIDITEIRAPFLKATALVSGVGIIIVIGGIFLFFRISNPLTRRILESEARMSAILSNVVDGIVTIDQKGAIETFNPAAEKLFGYVSGEVIGKNVKCLMPEPYHGEHDGYLQNYQDTNEAQIIGIGREVIGQRKDGSTFPMELAVGEMKVGGTQMFTGIVRDITDRKQAEMMKTEFVSTVSHELRTPLTSIKGSLGLIRSGAIGELPDKLKSMLDIAYNNSDRLVRLINDILDIEKIAAGKMDFQLEPMDLGPLLEQAVEANKGYGDEHGVRFVLSSDLPVAKIEGDHGRLMQVLANLMSNAAKFSPEGGSVEISLLKHNSGFRVSIADKGPGIPEDFKDKIFGKFHQADSSDTRQKGGTGLGLNITKAIVEHHNGTIDFESEVGQGTTFFFDLPTLQERQAVQGSVTVETRQYHVLICEDDPDIATLLELMLKQDGFTTDTARSAADAEGLLRNNTYDAMTLDLGLPDKDGITLIKELREKPETRDIPIVVVSANATEGAKEINGDAIGVIDWLEKPINQERLSEGLHRAVASSSNGNARILHVEDDPDILQVVSVLISDVAEIVPAKTLSKARSLLETQSFDLVILDLMLPDGDGEDLLPLLKRDDHKSTPVIVFSAKDISEQTAENIKAVLVKSKTSNEALLATIRSSIEARKSTNK